MAVGNIPEWAQSWLSAQEVEEFEKVVADVESQCQAEIVPVIAAQSLPTLHLRRWVFTLLTLFALTVLLVWIEFWGWVTLQKFMTALIASLLLCAWLSVKLGVRSWVLRWLAHPQDAESFVWQRAELEFYRHKMHDARQRSGVLLFVSLAEKKSVILADPSVSSYISKEMMEACAGDIAKGAGEGHLYTGLVNAVERLRPLLIAKWPRQPENLNELSNHVRFV